MVVAIKAPTEPATDGAAGKPIQVLEKAWIVLDAFTASAPELTLAQIKQRCDFPTSTTARLVRNLVGAGLLDRRDDRYRIGRRVLSWSESARRALDVVTLLTPVIRRLRDATGESAAVYQRRGSQRVCVAVAPSRHAVIWQLHVGMTTPLHVGSGGRALLAFDPDALAAVRQSARAGLESFTDRTLADLDRLEAALAETRRTGVAVSTEELAVDVAGVSAPVLGAGGEAVASLGVAGPAQRFRPEDNRRYIPAVLAASGTASRLMGGEFHPPRGSRPPDRTD